MFNPFPTAILVVGALEGPMFTRQDQTVTDTPQQPEECAGLFTQRPNQVCEVIGRLNKPERFEKSGRILYAYPPRNLAQP
jgi:hypothetical protein